MNKQNIHVLLVEDDINMGFLLKDSLEMGGYQVKHYEDGKSGLLAFFHHTFHICLLDVMLPEQDGFSIAENIRKKDSHTPIVFLTARGQKEDKIKGFKLGGDDYITKPFSVEELMLRMEAILKRSYPSKNQLINSQNLKCGNSRLNINNQTLIVNKKSKQLTYREAKLLKLFFSYPNQLLERDFILQLVWEDEGIIVGRSLDVFISRLRKILRLDGRLKIVNVHGVGYKLEVNG